VLFKVKCGERADAPNMGIFFHCVLTKKVDNILGIQRKGEAQNERSHNHPKKLDKKYHNFVFIDSQKLTTYLFVV